MLLAILVYFRLSLDIKTLAIRKSLSSAAYSASLLVPYELYKSLKDPKYSRNLKKEKKEIIYGISALVTSLKALALRKS